MKPDKKEPVYVFAVSYKIPATQYSGWAEPTDKFTPEQNQAAWDETRALMNRLASKE